MKTGYVMRWSIAALILVSIFALFTIGVYRLQFSSDILTTLPHNDAVLADARYVLINSEILEKIVIDVSLARDDRELLSACADFIETQLRESGLFKQVGLTHMLQLMPELLRYTLSGLPFMFSEQELNELVAPLLKPEKVRDAINAHIIQLSGIDGIGQNELMQRDPLNLRTFLLRRLNSLIPVNNANIVQGKIMTGDGRHVLIIAEPAERGSDTFFARKIDELMKQIASDVADHYGKNNAIIMTPVGSYRYSLDNEENAKKTVQNATLFSTIAVACLLLGSFPRPLIGLLALLPAFAGTMIAVFVYSLFNRSISLLAVGFGGAIISFTVDYGIAYLLFLDRRHETRGFQASHKVWSLGLLAMLTTAVSFAALSLSSFPALAEIGLFSALGVVFTYIFVHVIFPLIFVRLPGASREPVFQLQKFVNRISSSNNNWKAFVAFVYCVIMMFFARPEFHFDLTKMNAVTPQTLDAEKLLQKVWGDIKGNIIVMLEGETFEELARRNDFVTNILEREIDSGVIQPSFLQSSFIPGEETRRINFAAWQRFWSTERITCLLNDIHVAARDMGFATDAFEPFFAILATSSMPQISLTYEFYKLLGITKTDNGSSWRQTITLTPGESYIPEKFYERITFNNEAHLFDPCLFNSRLSGLLLSGFVKMSLIVGLFTVIVMFFYFFDWQLTLLGIAPIIFAIICTLGTLTIMEQPLGIPTLMVSVVVIGMGTDYALYLIRSYQRCYDEYSISLGLIRLSVFLSFFTTFLGFGVLAVCNNPMLKSAGIGLALGIGYSYIGAITILPPVLKKMFLPINVSQNSFEPGSRKHLKRVLLHYRHMGIYTRFFARFKILFDPMFRKLATFMSNPLFILDIGTGYGVPAVWLLELFPEAFVFGIEPLESRALIASRAFGKRGIAKIGRVPSILDITVLADHAIMLDMLHYLDDSQAFDTFIKIREKLCQGGVLIVRTTIPSKGGVPLSRYIETTRLKLRSISPVFRTAQQVRKLITEAGFSIFCEEPTAPGWEEIWFIARR